MSYRLHHLGVQTSADVVAFNPRNPFLMYSNVYGSMIEYDINSNRTRDRIGLHTSAVTSFAFSPRSGDVLISGSANGASTMWEYDVVEGNLSKVKDLTPDNGVRVVSVAVNVNFIAVCRVKGIEIYSLGSRGEKIRPAIRGIATAIPPLVLPETEFGNTSELKAQVRVAQTVPEYQSMGITADKSRDECAEDTCLVCWEKFITRGQLTEPVFFHETVFVKENGVEKKIWTCPMHMGCMDGLVKRGTLANCPGCRKKLDISRAQLEGVLGMYRYHQKLLAEYAAVNAHASKIGKVFKGHFTRKSSPGKAVANQIKGIYAS